MSLHYKKVIYAQPNRICRPTGISRLGYLFLFSLISLCAIAQEHSVRLSAEVPVQFAVGYQNKFSKHFSVDVSAGVLTEPNSTIILDVLKAFGTDEQIVLMIGDAFKFGLVGEIGVNYHFKNNYIGIYFQVIDLQAANTPTALIEDYFGTTVSGYPTKRGRQPSNPKFLTLKSTLFQGGVLYGRIFPLNKHYSIIAEFGCSANLYSISKLSTDTRDLSSLSKAVDAELARYYKEYAFVPSITLGLSYRFGSD